MPLSAGDEKRIRAGQAVAQSGDEYRSESAGAVGGQSRNDFTARLHIALKEIYETSYWLEPLYRTEYLSQAEFDNIAADCGESTGIVVRILKPTKQGAS